MSDPQDRRFATPICFFCDSPLDPVALTWVTNYNFLHATGQLMSETSLEISTAPTTLDIVLCLKCICQIKRLLFSDLKIGQYVTATQQLLDVADQYIPPELSSDEEIPF